MISSSLPKLDAAKKKEEQILKLKQCYQTARTNICRLRYDGIEAIAPDILELQKDLNKRVDEYFLPKIDLLEKSLETMFR